MKKPSNQGFFVFDFFLRNTLLHSNSGQSYWSPAGNVKGRPAKQVILLAFRLPALRAYSVSQPDNERSRIAGWETDIRPWHYPTGSIL